MIDTIRLTGPADYYKFSYDYERFTGIKRKDGEERISQVLVENKKDVHRIFYSPHNNQIVVELNPHKLIFKENVYNYEINSAILNDFVRRIGSVYFRGHNYYVARLDIGGVTTFDNFDSASQVLEKFRATRIPGARVARFKQQNYASSVFYASKNWSIKIYNKGIEMRCGFQDAPEFVIDKATGLPVANNDYVPPELRERNRLGFDLLSTLRVEKTYRFREMERIGLNDVLKTVTPLIANPTEFDRQLHALAIDKAKKGAMMQVTPYMGVHIDSFDIDLLMRDFFSVFQNWEFTTTPYITTERGSAGLLSVIDSYGGLSEVEASGVVSRSTIWRFRNKKRELSDFVPKIDFKNNLPQNVLKYWYYYRTLGINSLVSQ